MLKPTIIALSPAVQQKVGMAIPMVPDKPPPEHLALKAAIGEPGLTIDLIHEPRGRTPFKRAAFTFASPRSKPEVGDGNGFVSGDYAPFAGLERRFMGLAGAGTLALLPSGSAAGGVPILQGSPAFTVTTLNQYYGRPLAAPFFLWDSERCYFADCVPSTTTVRDSISAPPQAAPSSPLSGSAFAYSTSVALALIATADPQPWLRSAARSLVVTALKPEVSKLEAVSVINSAALNSAIQGLGFHFLTVPSVSATFTPFFHPFAETFARTVRTSGLDALFSLDVQGQQLPPASRFKARYGPAPGQVTNPDLIESVEFAQGSAYGQHNAELFLHLPLMLQSILSQNGRALEGMKWGTRVCDLLGVDNDPAEAWRYRPFREPEDMLSFAELLDSLSAPPGDPRREAALAQIEASQLYPFQPFRIARLRPDAMKKYAFLQVFNTRFDLADAYFRVYTPETVDVAHLHYLVLDAALGERPVILPGEEVPAKTYAELRPHLDAAGNAVIALESQLSALSAAQAPTKPDSGQSSALLLAASRYFCVPPNPKLLELWDRVADRLHKIRNGLTIDGDRRPLALFGPKIDPAALVRAAAGGGLGGLGELGQADRPNHRFPVQLRLAKERIERLGTINGALMQTLEKRDSEELAFRRATHEVELAEFIGAARQAQIDEAEQMITALWTQRGMARARWDHYREQLGLKDLEPPATDLSTGTVSSPGQTQAARALSLVDGSEFANTASAPQASAAPAGPPLILSQELTELMSSKTAADLHGQAAQLQSVAAVLKAIPDFEAAAKPMGAGAAIHMGGSLIGGALDSQAYSNESSASAASFSALNAGKQAAFVWRERDFVLQLNSAALEVLHIDQQIITATKTLAARVADKTLQDEQAKRNAAILDYLGSKFSNQDLYFQMSGQLAILQKQAWSAALAKLNDARAAFAFDFLPSPAPDLPDNLWDSQSRGILSADALMLAAHSLENAYLSADEDRLELTRTFSLKRINPFALVRLREMGQCSFSLTRALWDLYDPGHFDRRIVDVRLTIPSVTGPYVPIAATLTMTQSNLTDDSGNSTEINLPAAFSRIVTSSGRDDAGRFQPERPDDRYGPFEGAGGESTWLLELPTHFRQFPYRTIPDVLVTVRLRAQRKAELVDPAANNVAAELDQFAAEAGRTGLFHLVSLRYDLPDVWRAWQLAPGDPVKLTFPRSQLPFSLQQAAKLKAGMTLWPAPKTFLTENDLAAAPAVVISPHDGDPDKWDVTIPAPADANREDAYLLLNYAVSGA
jgi:receptor-binding and translocation channel-forming TcA subunit of Tc toxin